MAKSTFDVNEFLQEEVTGGFDTKLSFVPEYEGMCQIVQLGKRAGESEKGPWESLDVTWEVMDPSVAESVELPVARARQSIFIERDAKGGIARGKNKNTRLGVLLEAVGMNLSKPFRWGDLMHATAWCRIEEPSRNRDMATMSEVVRVAREAPAR